MTSILYSLPASTLEYLSFERTKIDSELYENASRNKDLAWDVHIRVLFSR